jgi:hypothetical protein
MAKNSYSLTIIRETITLAVLVAVKLVDHSSQFLFSQGLT